MGKKFTKEKVPELYAAKRAVIAYLKEHNIDPSDTKRIHSDPILKQLIYKLNKERDRVMNNYPALDRSNNIKLLKMSKKKELKKVKEVKAKEKEEAKEKKLPGRKATKYDYPQVKDEKTGKMREMTKEEKKKYRVEQRKKTNGSSSKPSTTKVKKEEKPSKKQKKDKAEKEVVTKTSIHKKGKKVKKEED